MKDGIHHGPRQGADPYTCLGVISEREATSGTDNGGALVQVFTYGNGYREVSVSLPTSSRSASDPDPEKAAKTDAERDAEWERNTRRARQSIRRKVLANDFDRLLTVTTRANITDASEFWGLWKRFLRLLREPPRAANRERLWAPVSLPYVAVLEHQRRGAGHIHAVVRGDQDVETLREVWRRVIRERIPDDHPSLWRPDDGAYAPNDGSLQVEHRKDTNPAKLAGYLSKYLSKQHRDDLKGAHRYRASLGLAKPHLERARIPATSDLATAAREASGGTDALSGDGFAWSCNWDKQGHLVE